MVSKICDVVISMSESETDGMKIGVTGKDNQTKCVCRDRRP